MHCYLLVHGDVPTRRIGKMCFQNTPEEYFIRAITIPFLDDMISHLNNRFSDVQRKAIMALSIVPSVFTTDQEADSSLEEELVEHYPNDLPSPSTLQELHMWKCKWKVVEKSGLPDTPSKSLEHADESMFPNIHILLHLICTLPVTSSECDCSISVLRRLKKYLRSTMGQERMTGLALMHIEYGMELILDDIINFFFGQHQRRMLFCRQLAKEFMLLYMLFLC